MSRSEAIKLIEKWETIAQELADQPDWDELLAAAPDMQEQVDWILERIQE